MSPWTEPWTIKNTYTTQRWRWPPATTSWRSNQTQNGVATQALLEQHWRCLTTRLNRHSQFVLDVPNWILNWTTHVDRSPDVWGQPVSNNYTCLRWSHHLPSEEMYVLEWKRRQETNAAHSLHGQVPAERLLKRECFIRSVRLANVIHAVNGSDGRTWHHTTALSTWMKV